MKNELVQRVAILVSIVGVMALFGALTLHLGRALSWRVLAIPTILFATIQIACFAAIIDVRRRKSLRMGVLVFGLYWLLSGLIVIYYGSRWGVLTGLGNSDLWQFSACIAVITIAGILFVPRQWSDKIEDRFAGIKCARCGHYHEGHDCSCGCRADQFRYPPFNAPVF